MATLSEMMMANTAANAQTQAPGAGLGDAMSKGVQLAQQKEQTEALKLQQAEMKEKLEAGKFQKATAYMQNLARARPEIAKRMIPKVKESLMASGIVVDEGILDLMASDEDYKKRFGIIGSALMGEANNPELRTQAMQAFGDIGMFDEGLKLFEGQNKMASQLEAANMRAQAARDALNANLAYKREDPNHGMTKGQIKTDEMFAEEALKFGTNGFADVNKQLASLQPALDKLSKGKGSGGALDALPESARDFVARENAAIQQNINSVVQSSLKATLGGQFTQVEADQLMARTFNPRQSPKENLRRVKLLTEQIKQMAKAKQEAVNYFENNNRSLTGYKFQNKLDKSFIYNIDFGAADEGKKKPTASGSPAPSRTPAPGGDANAKAAFVENFVNATVAKHGEGARAQAMQEAEKRWMKKATAGN